MSKRLVAFSKLRVSPCHTNCCGTLFRHSLSSRGIQTKIEPPAQHTSHASPNNYAPVVNKNTIFSEIDASLGVSSPASIEYLYVVPQLSFSFPNPLKRQSLRVSSSSNPYGHAALKYTISTGEVFVMNIVGKPRQRMINFLSAEDYLFGDPSKTCSMGSEQGGVFCRSFVGFRLENYPSALVDEMHAYFLSLAERERNKKITFNLFSLPGWLHIPFLQRCYERGNCALWTSKGLRAAKVFKQSTILPKYIFVKFYAKAINSWGWNSICGEKYQNDNKENEKKHSADVTDVMKQRQRRFCSVVYYNRLDADVNVDVNVDVDGENGSGEMSLDRNGNLKAKVMRKKEEPKGWVTPLLFTKVNFRFKDLKPFANIFVDLVPVVEDVSGNGNESDGDECVSKYRAQISKAKPWQPTWLPTWTYEK